MTFRCLLPKTARRELDLSEALPLAEPHSLDIPIYAARLISFSFASVNAYCSPPNRMALLDPLGQWQLYTDNQTR